MNTAHRRPWRFAFATVAAVTAALAPAGAAAAHGTGQTIPDSAYYRSSLTAVVPSPPGVTVRVDPAGEYIQLTDSSSAQIVVLGYTREPYLRITSTAVAENLVSQTTYLNRSLFTDSIPNGQDAGGLAPVWRQISTSGTVRWHDHRIHWMGQQRPPAVQADPSHPHLIGTWEVHATADGLPFQVRGDLRWIGKPARTSGIQTWVLWLLVGLDVVICILIVLAVRRRLRRAEAGPDASPANRVETPPGHQHVYADARSSAD
jgi:hypothetical protein